jgi:hypothetical protein
METDGTNTPLGEYDIPEYVSGCAPGNVAVYVVDESGTQTQICSGLCQPADTWTGAANLASVQNGVAPYGCTRPSVNGSTDDNCIFIWTLQYFSAADPESSLEPWSDHLGVCFDFARDLYDPAKPEGGSDKTVATPNCAALALNPSLDPSTCSAAAPCSSPAQAAALFGAVDQGCVSYETAIANPDPPFAHAIHRRALDRIRFAQGVGGRR